LVIIISHKESGGIIKRKHSYPRIFDTEPGKETVAPGNDKPDFCYVYFANIDKRRYRSIR